MEHSPSWEANMSSASQEIPRILWNPNVHYCIRRNLPPVPVLSQIDPGRDFTSHFLKIHFNIVFLSTKRSFNILSPRPSDLPANSCTHLFSLPYVPHTPPILFFLSWTPEFGYMLPPFWGKNLSKLKMWQVTLWRATKDKTASKLV